MGRFDCLLHILLKFLRVFSGGAVEGQTRLAVVRCTQPVVVRIWRLGLVTAVLIRRYTSPASECIRFSNVWAFRADSWCIVGRPSVPQCVLNIRREHIVFDEVGL